MAGLIQQQMGAGAPAQNPMAQGGMPAGADPMADPMAEMEGDEEGPDPDTDPGFQSAIEFTQKALYEQGAARDVAQSLQSAPDRIDGLATTAYEITATVDERTEGAVVEDLLIPLGMKILEEVVEIGEAAGLQYQPSEIAQAFQQMLLRFLGEQGVDTTQLQQQMDEIDPEAFNQAAMAEE
jgi:hypothetical protein